MGKVYTEELASWSATRPTRCRRRQDQVAVTVLALKAEVLQALSAGYSLTTIWEHMREIKRLSCSYETFRRHVKRFNTPNQLVYPTQIQQPAKYAGPQGVQAAPVISQPVNASLGSFHFQPQPNKEELI